MKSIHVAAGVLVASAAVILLASGCFEDRSASPASLAAPSAAEAAVPQISMSDLPAELNLTADQKVQMQEALDQMKQQRGQMQGRWHDAGGGPGGPPEGPRPAIGFLDQASKILTPDQFLVLARYLAQRRDSMQPAGPFQGGFPPMIAKRLGLTADQQDKLRAAWQAHATERKDLWQSLEDGKITADQAAAQARILRENMESSLKQTLTADQWDKVQAFRSKRMDRAAGHRSDNLEQRLSERADFLGRVLGLQDSQTAQVQKILDGTVPQRQSLLQQLRSGSIQPEEMAIRVWQIEKDAATQIRALLNAEQAQRFDALVQLLPRGPRPGMM